MPVPVRLGHRSGCAGSRRTGWLCQLYLPGRSAPGTAVANAVLKTEQEKAKQEFESKATGLSDKDKQELDQQLGQRVEQKRLELLQPISAKVVAAANEVAKEKGLPIVIGKNEVVCGGVDITADVLKKITGK